MTSATPSKQLLFPPGRVVQGSLYKAQDKDANGQPRVYPPNHAKAGQPKISYFFAVAIPKQGEAAWWDTAWGKEAVAIASTSWPQGQWQTPSFAWKIEDGDSTIPNKRGRKNATTEGMAGCWIVNFSSGFAPKIFLVNPGQAPQPLVEPDVVKLGYWVEVLGTIRSNETASNPGIYLNHDMVGFRGRDKEIFAGPDPNSVGFGAAAVPGHVSMAPVANAAGMPAQVPTGTPGVPATPAMPGTPAMATPAVPGGPAAAVPGSPAPVAVQPNAGFIAPPVAGAATPAMPGGVGVPAPSSPHAAPAAPSAPAAAYVCPAGAPAGYRMANPNGARYEQYRANNWSDALLVQHGHMVKL